MDFISYEPKDYSCPFCRLINHISDEVNTTSNIVYEDKYCLAFVSPKWWINNPGNVLVIPKVHAENIYTISDFQLSKVYLLVKKLAKAIKITYPCDGISTRQHNEPAGNQDVWHFHVHVFPRYKNDLLYQNHDKKSFVSQELRMKYIKKLKDYFKNNSLTGSKEVKKRK